MGSPARFSMFAEGGGVEILPPQVRRVREFSRFSFSTFVEGMGRGEGMCRPPPPQ